MIKGMRGPEADMYAWIRANTPKDAVFLTPPQLERFRLLGERAIVVDWKGSAYVPSELVEWYRRLEDVSGRKGFRRSDDLSDGYGDLDAARLDPLQKKYKFDYVVVGPRPAEGPARQGRLSEFALRDPRPRRVRRDRDLIGT